MFIHDPAHKRDVPLRHVVPNLITTVSLCCGLASMHYALRADWDRAMFAVLLAAVFDALDGRFARLLRATSSFGAVLDSLADFLSFGVAPAMLLYQWMLRDEDEWGLLAVVAFVLCSALRLARFTSKVKPTRTTESLTPDERRASIISSKFFEGLPTPAAAAAAMVPPMLAHSKLIGVWTAGRFGIVKGAPVSLLPAWGVVVFTVVIAALMVSSVPMFSFKKVRISRFAVVPLLMFVGLAAVLAVKDVWLMASLLGLGYLATIPASVARRRWMKSAPLESIAPVRTGGAQPLFRVRHAEG